MSMLRRRALIASHKAPDIFDGFIFGKRLNSVGETAASNCCITKWYNVKTGDRLRYIIGAPEINLVFWVQDTQGIEHFGEWLTRSNTESMNYIMKLDCVKARFSMSVDNLDNNYIYNVTTGEYLFKGKNV